MEGATQEVEFSILDQKIDLNPRSGKDGKDGKEGTD